MEGNCEQLGLRIRRKRTVLVYIAVGFLVLVVGVVVMARWLARSTEALMPAVPSGRVKVEQANYRIVSVVKYTSAWHSVGGWQYSSKTTAGWR